MTSVSASIAAVYEQFRAVIEASAPPADAVEWRVSRYRRGLRLAEEIEARIGPLAGKRVLDVGAAYGGDIAALYARGAACVGADKFDHSYDALKARIAPDGASLQFTLFDCTKAWPLPDASFDVVISLGVLEFIEDLDLFFREMGRVLKPGGLAIVYTPAALASVRCDAHYHLPLVSLLPARWRSWVAEKVCRRSYRFTFSSHTCYSALHFKRYAARCGCTIHPDKYARSKIMARAARLPFARAWQALIRWLAFDFVVVTPRVAEWL